jgi:hypothetical protein
MKSIKKATSSKLEMAFVFILSKKSRFVTKSKIEKIKIRTSN